MRSAADFSAWLIAEFSRCRDSAAEARARCGALPMGSEERVVALHEFDLAYERMHGILIAQRLLGEFSA